MSGPSRPPEGTRGDDGVGCPLRGHTEGSAGPRRGGHQTPSPPSQAPAHGFAALWGAGRGQPQRKEKYSVA